MGDDQMINELLLAASLVVIFGMTLVAYRLFGKTGLYCMTAIATILANIEVLIMVDAFGMEQTLGNVLFAVTFVITDILSECEGKKAANKAVFIGVFSSVLFLAISQSWLLYQPAASDWVSPSIHTVFASTPRLLFASFSVYVISQLMDVWLYHKWWEITDKKFHNHRRFLWLRNNGSTLISQLINTVLFNVFAFYGTYDTPTLLSIIWAGYLIYVVTALLDTPVVYAARWLHDKGLTKRDAPAEN